ncbi:hypothetical protein LQV63_11445 [Paenibacillus profundus]|uniref:Group-specific protein n=1 Tax=Paenibacillus profundus TaxID=1173085 RepID=A0ABS8YHW5_9BACL|nr:MULTISPECIES: hypothetical protein [Paenibacillus]MCE5169926.1 hypothetical protein [Paenibacillus profundus]MCM3339832.1 hypothetical protein [Paenibacillus sp. MER TA 81-3]
MNASVLILVACAVILVAVIATIVVGNSKENREGNPTYDQKTKNIFVRLSVYYTIAGLICLALFLALVFN